jgi:hypothetical protein
LVHIIRGPIVECVHRGHVASGITTRLIAGWGNRLADPAAQRDEDDAGPAACGKRCGRCGGPVGGQRLALACASHKGAAIHTDMVT